MDPLEVDYASLVDDYKEWKAEVSDVREMLRWQKRQVTAVTKSMGKLAVKVSAKQEQYGSLQSDVKALKKKAYKLAQKQRRQEQGANGVRRSAASQGASASQGPPVALPNQFVAPSHVSRSTG